MDKAATTRDVVTVSTQAGSPEGSGTIADQLLDNFMAQSLDLPPKAAKVGADRVAVITKVLMAKVTAAIC